MSDFKDLSALKARTDREMVAFLSAFLLNEMDRRWFLATKIEGEDLRSWSERVASEMWSRIAMIIDVSAGQMSERIARWWHDVRIRRVSVRMLDEGDPTPVVRVSEDCFVDPACADNSPAFIRVNALGSARLPETQFRLADVAKAWLRLRRGMRPEALSPEIVRDEMARGRERVRAFSIRRKAERVAEIRRDARRDPQGFVTRMFLAPSGDQERFEALAGYADKPRSAIRLEIMRRLPGSVISRAAALSGRSDAVRGSAKLLDYHLRMPPACEGEEDSRVRDSVILMVRDRVMPDRKLRLALDAIRPKEGENVVSYGRFLHDLCAPLRQSRGLPAGLYAGDLLNAISSRNLTRVSRDLAALDGCSPECKAAAVAKSPKSLAGAAREVVIMSQAETVAALSAGLEARTARDPERTISNVITLGVTERMARLLRDAASPEGPRVLESVPVEGFDASVEASSIDVPDGWLAMALPSICVPFGGEDHLSHFGTRSGYVCVYDKGDIVMGGFVVEAGDVWLLNNLQGGLGGRLNAPAGRAAVASAVETALLRAFGTVVVGDLYFNGMSLPAELGLRSREMTLALPDIRLDNQSEGTFFVLGTRRECEEE